MANLFYNDFSELYAAIEISSGKRSGDYENCGQCYKNIYRAKRYHTTNNTEKEEEEEKTTSPGSFIYFSVIDGLPTSVDRKTVGQYTLMNDCNGIPIFEHDIISMRLLVLKNFLPDDYFLKEEEEKKEKEEKKVEFSDPYHVSIVADIVFSNTRAQYVARLRNNKEIPLYMIKDNLFVEGNIFDNNNLLTDAMFYDTI